MNRMFVSPWLSVSPLGPVTCAHPHNNDLIHLRMSNGGTAPVGTRDCVSIRWNGLFFAFTAN